MSAGESMFFDTKVCLVYYCGFKMPHPLDSKASSLIINMSNSGRVSSLTNAKFVALAAEMSPECVNSDVTVSFRILMQKLGVCSLQHHCTYKFKMYNLTYHI